MSLLYLREHRSILNNTISCSLENSRVNKWTLAQFDLNKGCFRQRRYFGSCHLPHFFYLERKTAFEANYAKNISKENSISLGFSTQKLIQRSTNICRLFYTITSIRLNWNVHMIHSIALKILLFNNDCIRPYTKWSMAMQNCYAPLSSHHEVSSWNNS